MTCYDFYMYFSALLLNIYDRLLCLFLSKGTVQLTN